MNNTQNALETFMEKIFDEETNHAIEYLGMTTLKTIDNPDHTDTKELSHTMLKDFVEMAESQTNDRLKIVIKVLVAKLAFYMTHAATFESLYKEIEVKHKDLLGLVRSKLNKRTPNLKIVYRNPNLNRDTQ